MWAATLWLSATTEGNSTRQIQTVSPRANKASQGKWLLPTAWDSLSENQGPWVQSTALKVSLSREVAYYPSSIYIHIPFPSFINYTLSSTRQLQEGCSYQVTSNMQDCNILKKERKSLVKWRRQRGYIIYLKHYQQWICGKSPVVQDRTWLRANSALQNTLPGPLWWLPRSVSSSADTLLHFNWLQCVPDSL